MTRGFSYLEPSERKYVQPFEKHVAESQWQYCHCKSCQDYRRLIETAPPGTKMNFDTYRHKDERYPSRAV